MAKNEQTFWAVVSKRTGKIVNNLGHPEIWNTTHENYRLLEKGWSNRYYEIKEVRVEVVG